MALHRSRIAAAGVLVVLAACCFLAWKESSDAVVLVETDKLSDAAMKAAQAKALFRLAGGHHMLADAKKVTGDADGSELKHKDKDALDILGSMFGSKKKGSAPPAKKPAGDDRGRTAHSPSAGGGVHEAAELKKMKERQEMTPPSPAAALQGLIAGWSGAGWWQPCGEVCAPAPGEKKTKANFEKFMACEMDCRKTKTESLKKVMSKIQTAAGGGAAPANEKPVHPRTMKKLSKFLLKWAEGQGLPASLADKANDNIKTNMQVGQSIAGMLIAGWSGAGWWKPCGEVCAPAPGEKKTKANFNKFMACQASCRRSKGEYLRGMIAPKEVIKHMAHG